MPIYGQKFDRSSYLNYSYYVGTVEAFMQQWSNNIKPLLSGFMLFIAAGISIPKFSAHQNV